MDDTSSLRSYEYKIILVGDMGVGKTSLFIRIKTGQFCDSQSFEQSNIKCDWYQYQTTVDDDQISVLLYDTAGLDRFSPVNYYRRASGALLVYDIENYYSFHSLPEWTEDAMHFVEKPDHFRWALIGNKTDLQNTIEAVHVAALCEQMKTKLFYGVSAKTGHNVMKAFNDLVADIHRSNKQRSGSSSLDKTIRLNSSQPKTVHKTCC